MRLKRLKARVFLENMDTFGKQKPCWQQILMELFRQQLCYEDDEELAGLLCLKPGQIKNFDVFVTELMDGNLSEKDKNKFKKDIDVFLVQSIIVQLLDGLDQLEKSGRSHNDIKPTNVLY